MTGEKKESLKDRLAGCVKQVRGSTEQAEPVVEQVRSGKLGKDYLQKIVEFLNGFDNVRAALDELPMEGGRLPEKLSPEDRRAVEELLPELIKEVEKLVEYQALLMGTLKKGIEVQSGNLKKVRDAKKMFEKFMKKPEGGPRFFDQEG